MELERRGLSESTIRSAYTIISAVLDTAVRDRALAQNPAHAVRRPRVTQGGGLSGARSGALTALLVAKLSRYAPLFVLLVNTGLLRGEALALHWSDIDLDAKLLWVRGLSPASPASSLTETKTPRSRRVVPSPHCGAAAARRARQSEGRAAEGRLNVAAQRRTCSPPSW